MHPKSFISLDNADHLLSRTEDAQYAANVIASWAMRYLEQHTKQTATAQGVLVSTNTEQGFLCTINASGHRLVADEPIRVGGSNLGPSPYDYLTAALGKLHSHDLEHVRKAQENRLRQGFGRRNPQSGSRR
ncbi:MAG: hypothetical protein ACI9WC_000286 [Arenicella sp.]|jgi:hypothetical protein